MQSVSHPRDAIVNLLEQERTYTILLADRALRSVGFPERAAIELHADLLLLDDMKARRIATDRGLVITGIIGILDRAATMKLIDLPAAVQSLQNTSFWASERLFERLLDKHA